MDCSQTVTEYQTWMLHYLQDEQGLYLVSGKRDTDADFTLAGKLPADVFDFATCFSESHYVQGISTLADLRQVAADQGFAVLSSNIIQCQVPVRVTSLVVPVYEAGKINNAVELLAQWINTGEDLTEEQAQDVLPGYVYRGTECGAWIHFYACGVAVGSIVGGSDQDTETHDLYYPFTLDKFKQALSDIESEADTLWKEANCSDDCEEE
jgi:hypothetical protein